MAYRRNLHTEQSVGPFCQATGCFEKAAYYLVVKETEEPNYHETRDKTINLQPAKLSSFDTRMRNESNLGFDGFKMIMYFCKRHESEFKYLIRGGELQVSKECRLHAPKIRVI
jgi:hypothetical protein